MKHAQAIFAIGLLIFLSACKNDPIDKLEWLEGKWQSEQEGYLIIEDWKRQTNELQGQSYYMRDQDSTLQEKAIIKENKDGKLAFYVTVTDQNEGEEIVFEMKSSSENKIAFENKTHDFPKEIVYTRTGDSLTAKVSGVVDGEDEFFEIRYGLVKGLED